MTRSNFLLSNIAQGLPHKVAQNPAALRAAVFFSLSVKNLKGGLHQTPCTGEGSWGNAPHWGGAISSPRASNLRNYWADSKNKRIWKTEKLSREKFYCCEWRHKVKVVRQGFGEQNCPKANYRHGSVLKSAALKSFRCALWPSSQVTRWKRSNKIALADFVI